MPIAKSQIRYPKNCMDCSAPTTGQRPRCRSCGCKISKLSEKNPLWRGDKVGCNPLHRWVEKRMSLPRKCVACGATNNVDLSNKGIYNRDLTNWEWLCRRCHMKKDGRLNKLMSFSRSRKRPNCKICPRIHVALGYCDTHYRQYKKKLEGKNDVATQPDTI